MTTTINTECEPFLTVAAKRGLILVMMLIFFLMTSYGPSDMAVAFFYIAVVAVSGEAGSRRWVLAIAIGCAALTMLSCALFHDMHSRYSLEPCLGTLFAGYVVTYMVLSHKEIRNRLLSQQGMLHRSQTLLENTQSLSSTGSVRLRLPSMDMEWSAQAMQLFGFTTHDSPSMPDLLKSIHMDDHDRLLSTIQGLCRQQHVIDAEFRINLTDRRIKTIHLFAKPTGPMDDVMSEITFVLMDVSCARESEDRFQKRQSELAQVNRVLTFNEIIASIAHEVNQPLAAVVTSAESGLRWLNRPIPDIVEVDLALLRVVEQAGRASAFMKKLREQSVDSTRLAEPVCIRDILSSAETFLMRDSRLNQVKVSFHVNDDAPLVAADKVQIQHVVMNLVSNSIESLSLDHTIEVREVMVVASRSISGGLSVSVRDSGTGIKREIVDKLFTPFFSTKKNGVGVGLAICRSIIEAHGGRIWAGGESHEGAIFNFSLPQLGKVSI